MNHEIRWNQNRLIRSCWHGGVEAVGAWTQRGAFSVHAPRQQALILSMLRRV